MSFSNILGFVLDMAIGSLTLLLVYVTVCLFLWTGKRVVWLANPFRLLASAVREPRYPIPGIDFRFLGGCKDCDDYTGFMSIHGGKLYQCSSCGGRNTRFNFRQKDIADMRRSSYAFWMDFKAIPYDWHKHTEDEKMAMLGRKKKCW